MSDRERLARLLHEAYVGQMWCEPDWDECDWREMFRSDADDLIAAGVSFAASQPPSGDALREAAQETVRLGILWSGRPDYEDAQLALLNAIDALRAALATPAPLDVEPADALRDMAAALYETDPPESWMRTGTDEYRKRAAAMLAILERERRAYAEQPTVEHQPWCQRGCTCGASET